MTKAACILLAVSLATSNCFACHDGPDPIASWYFNKNHIKGNELSARLGPDGRFISGPKILKDETGESVVFDGRWSECVIAADLNKIKSVLPKNAFTVAGWFSVEQPTQYGAFIGVLQDNGDYEKGWLLGYNNDAFCFGLATSGADDGDGRMTYLSGKTKYETGKMYHVAAVYDGTSMNLYVNGKLDAESKNQSGPILYPEKAPFVIGAYHDDNEFFPLRGRIREIAIYDMAAKTKWVKEEFSHDRRIAESAPVFQDTDDQFVVKPFLQYGTQSGMTVVWQTTTPCEGILHWGEDARCGNSINTTEKKCIQQVRIEDLSPETQYFYWVEAENKEGKSIESRVATFQTACLPDTPFAFAVIGDTQHNPKVSGPIAALAWNQRPNFLLHAGDLVDQGANNDDWIDEFFASMHVLISRVPMYSVLGNHEQNAKNYFDYMALPEPEYYYQFSYGNTDFFLIDSNRKVHPASEQYQWLDDALAQSKATWKFVCHHHPPYSSDENDYGDLWKTNKSTRGDTRVRKLVPLYEKHGVDVVWSGHIHSYERTWPLKENKAVNVNGTIYMITGGGGGGLETPGPYRPFFQNNVRRGHHYTMVAINGNTLELKSFDINNRLFDSVTIKKQ